MNKLSLFLFCVMLISCNQKPKGVVDDEEKRLEEIILNQKLDNSIGTVLYYDFSISDSIVNDFIKTKVVRNPLNVKLLLDNYKGKAGNKNHIDNFLKVNSDFWIRYGSLPYVRNDVYLTRTILASYKEGLTYDYRTRIYLSLEMIAGYIGHKPSLLLGSRDMCFSLEKKQLQIVERNFYSVIDESRYDRKVSNVKGKIGDHEVQEVVYMLKDKVNTVSDLNVPVELTVYVTSDIDPMVNKALPIQLLHEPYAIVKAVVRYRTEDSFHFVLELKESYTGEFRDGDSAALGISKFWLDLDKNTDSIYSKNLKRYFITPTLVSKNQ